MKEGPKKQTNTGVHQKTIQLLKNTDPVDGQVDEQKTKNGEKHGNKSQTNHNGTNLNPKNDKPIHRRPANKTTNKNKRKENQKRKKTHKVQKQQKNMATTRTKDQITKD